MKYHINTKHLLAIVAALYSVPGPLLSTAYAAAGSMTTGYDHLDKGNYIYFGSYQQQKRGDGDRKDPISWQVLGKNLANTGSTTYDAENIDTHPAKPSSNNNLFLMSEKILDQAIKFNEYSGSNISGGSNFYGAYYNSQNSDGAVPSHLAAFLDGKATYVDNPGEASTDTMNTNFAFINRAFDETLKNQILDTTIEQSSISNDHKVFALSRSEVTNADYGFDASASTADSARVASLTAFAASKSSRTAWWLRSANSGDVSYFACYVYSDGDADSRANVDDSGVGVRPALFLNPSSIIFTSPAGISDTTKAAARNSVGSFITTTFFSPEADTQYYHLTLADENINAPTLGGMEVGPNDVEISYSNAKTGTHMYISALTSSDNGNSFNQYANLADTSSSGSGSVKLTYGDISFNNGDTQTLYLFGEQGNIGNSTEGTDLFSDADNNAIVASTVYGSVDYATPRADWKQFAIANSNGQYIFTLGSGYNTTANPVTIRSGGAVGLTSGTTYAQRFTMHGGSTLFGNNAILSGSMDIRGASTIRGDLSFASGSSLNFILPENATSSAMLTLSDATAATDLSAATISVDATAADLSVGDSVVLVDATTDVTSGYNSALTVSGLTDVGYTITTADNDLYFKITSITENANTHAPAESVIAAMALLNRAGDLLASNASNLDLTESVSALADGYYGKNRYISGSHVDLTGGGMMVGAGRSFHNLQAALFAEGGLGDFDIYCQDVHGTGSTKYYGAGLMLKYSLPQNWYLTGSLHAGRVKTSFRYLGVIDDTAPYYGGSATLGYKLTPSSLHKLDLNLFASYLLGHTGSISGTINGLHYRMNPMTSHRAQLGVTGAYQLRSSIIPYMSLAFDHEFNGKANLALTNTSSAITAPSIKGSSGVAELGCQFKGKRWTGKLGVEGALGKRRGVSVRGGLHYQF